MKIAVLIKHVPDTETKIQINSDGSGIENANVKFIVNPYDEFAVEEAIQLAEKHNGETVVITMGPDNSVDSLRTALAMGIQKAIHIDTAGTWYDAYATAKVLSQVLQEGGYDLILCGKQAIDNDNAQVVQMVAELLNIPQVMIAENVEVEGDQVKVTRRAGGGNKEVYSPKLPVIIGAEKGLNTPRYASLPGIMKAKSKPVDKKSAAELLNSEGNLIEFKNYSLPPERQAGKVIEGDAATQAQQLVKLLREEAKVI